MPQHPDPETPQGRQMKPGDIAPPGTPGTGEALCPVCSGKGTIEGRPCSECNGTGTVTQGVGGA